MTQESGSYALEIIHLHKQFGGLPATFWKYGSALATNSNNASAANVCPLTVMLASRTSAFVIPRGGNWPAGMFEIVKG